MKPDKGKADWEQDDQGQFIPRTLRGVLLLLAGFAVIWVLVAVVFILGASK